MNWLQNPSLKHSVKYNNTNMSIHSSFNNYVLWSIFFYYKCDVCLSVNKSPWSQNETIIKGFDL